MGRAAGPAPGRRGVGRGPPAGARAPDFGARVLAAIPAIAFAIFHRRAQGGTIFALGMFLLGAICLHELYSLFADVRPVRLAGFLSLAGLLAAARWGTQFQVVLVARRRCRWCSS